MRRTPTLSLCPNGTTHWSYLNPATSTSAFTNRTSSSVATNHSSPTSTALCSCSRSQISPSSSQCKSTSTSTTGRYTSRPISSKACTSSFPSSTLSQPSRSHPPKKTKLWISSESWIYSCGDNSSILSWCPSTRFATKCLMRRSSTTC